ncbi:polyprenyl synthetase family protein [Streptomyces sp. NPDC127190]|uniref:polyprenyl synthetase family protein n=1 Tax=unclassified Streptomyces TaxID=2593676 RepID=UPI00362C4FA0
MSPTQAKEHHGAAPPPVPRLLPVPGSPGRTRADESDGHGHTSRAGAVCPAETSDARQVDADVPAAVGRVLDGVLTERVARAHAVDEQFATDLAAGVADFTRVGGKRTRSQLLWWSLRACGGEDRASIAAALRIGAALELLQTCALVHDDVMDGALLRRGRPALHQELRARYAGSAPAGRAGRFGEAAGILAGDLALAWADDLVAETVLPATAVRPVRRLWSDMRTEMVAGQYLDVHDQVTSAQALPRALHTACLKSALYSVARPLALGASLAGADERTVGALDAAGRCVGMAFQLRDDLDDVFGDPGRTGKSGGSDIREGKPTYLTALARARAAAAGDERALEVLDRSLGDTGLTDAGLAEVRAVLEATGARTVVGAKAARLVERGLRHFDGASLDAEAGSRLRALLCRAAGGGPGPARAPGLGGRESGR